MNPLSIWPLCLFCLTAATGTLAMANSTQADIKVITDNAELLGDTVQPVRKPWNQRHAEGWFWRDLDPEKPEVEDEPEKKAEMINPNTLYPSMTDPLVDPLAALEKVQKAVEISKARAVLQPTTENIMNYLRVQDELFKKSTLLADNWQRTVWRNPSLDYNQVRPYSPVALTAYNKAFKKDRREALRNIAKEYGLYFVIAESCPYCHAMAPYLKRFADNYGFTVITVTIDGGTVPEFPNAKYSPEFAEQLNVKITPAIIIAKPDENIIQPISYGFIDLKELESRIYRLFELEPGKPNYQVSTTRLQP